jgi:CRP-like cAMP-binding protein
MIQPKLDFQRFVDRLTSRSILSAEERDTILNLPSHTRQVGSNRDVVGLGETIDHTCFVVAGIVGRFDQLASGKRQITALHIPGDMTDLHSVVQPTCTSALQALSVATIHCVPHSAIRSAAARYPAIAEALWRDCAVDARILAQWVVNVGRRSAIMRLAHLFCEMAVRLGVAPAQGEIVYPFAVTQVQLGDATALTPIHVNRSLKTLRQDGLAEVGAGTVRIRDWDGLAALAEFDPFYLQLDIREDQRLKILLN